MSHFIILLQYKKVASSIEETVLYHQVVICGSMIALQVLGGVAWLVHDPPSTSPMYSNDKLNMVITCQVAPRPMMISFR